MENWSHLPIDSRFRIKLFLDTNVLVYLIDKTFPKVNQFFEILRELQFVDFISSHYVIFEFAGIRRKEHYLHKVLEFNTGADNRVNLSSLLKYQNRLDAEVSYDDEREAIEVAVQSEISKIYDEFNIDYQSNLFHASLLAPTIDLILGSKISKEDSLVAISAVYPQENSKLSNVSIVSNDSEYVKFVAQDNIEAAFQRHGLEKPTALDLSNLKLHSNNSTRNLVDKNKITDLKEFTISKLIELIETNNSETYLGKTIRCGTGNNFTDVLCFELIENFNLEQNIYLTIIDSELNFVFNLSKPIVNFWKDSPIQNYPFSSEEKSNISFKLDLAENSITQEIFNSISKTGNLVFINSN